MELYDLGYNEVFDRFRADHNLNDFDIGRVTREHKERYIVCTINGDIEAEITGNLRYSASSRDDFPAVGDWVALASYDSDYAIIHRVFPRFSVIRRQAVGHYGETQIIATNIDFAFLVQAVDRDFSINRLERYLAICHTACVEPIILLSKADLIDKNEIDSLMARIKERIPNSPVIVISNQTQYGIDQLRHLIVKGKTYCLLGSSGVGKSTLLNILCGKSIMRTDAVSTSTSKGRHITSHREMVVLGGGGIIIDNPGMREVGIADASHGLEATFDVIYRYSQDCKYKDCTHTTEEGCSVVEAIENGLIDRLSYENYLRMEREKVHFEATLFEKRKREKQFGKLVKNFNKDIEWQYPQ